MVSNEYSRNLVGTVLVHNKRNYRYRTGTSTSTILSVQSSFSHSTLVIMIVLYLNMNNEKLSILESERQIHDALDIQYSA